MKKIYHNIESYTPEMVYGFENKLMAQKYVEYILDDISNKNNFLELGVGFGETIHLLKKNFTHLSVVDGELKLIEKALQQHKSVSFIHSFFEDFISEQKFDGIGMGFVIDIVDDPVRLLNHYSNMLNTGSKIYISVGNAASLHRMVAYNAGMLDDIHAMSNQNLSYGHQRFWTYDEWCALFEKTNLSIVTAYGLYLKPFSTKQLSSLDLNESIYNSLAITAKTLPSIANACFFILEKK